MKMRNKILNIVMAGALVAALPACDKLEEFGDTNNNPNATTSPNTAALLTNTLAGMGGYVWGNANATAGALYAQYMSETQYTEASRYAVPTLNWSGYYTGALYDLQNVINYNSDPATAASAAASGSNANQIATARILKAYIYWTLTDAYGDLPYFEALKGEGALAYDEQSLIYADLIKELKEAVDQFDGGDVYKGDIVYGGNTTKWKKFANSVRLLIALRMSKVDAATSQAEVNSALSHSAGVIETVADDFLIAYPGGNYNHPLYAYYNITQRFDYALSKTISDNLNNNGDLRANAYGSSTVGFPYGLDRDDAVDFANSNPNWALVFASTRRQATSSLTLVGSAHTWLARAEAIQRGWVAGSAATAYQTGIQRSWEQWGVYDATAFASFMAQPNINLTTNALTKIQTQQWVAFYPDGVQGWSNWRRTGVPALTPAVGTGTPDLPIPRKLPYGPDEFNLNKVNAEAGAAKYTVGGVTNSQNARVWWDN
ncbi:MAG: SusD/RagB family nutrient-binding outer membrane lipoprotein [Chitinophagaceae bacterium]